MVLKGVFAAAVCMAILAAGSVVVRTNTGRTSSLTLDLSKAVLSPKPLGPPAQFEPMRVEVKTDAQGKAVPVDAAPVHDAVPKAVNAAPKAAPKIRVGHARAEKPHSIVHAKPATAPTKLVRSHSNPLDAQASDTRIQVWPCRSGGICNWQRMNEAPLLRDPDIAGFCDLAPARDIGAKIRANSSDELPTGRMPSGFRRR